MFNKYSDKIQRVFNIIYIFILLRFQVSKNSLFFDRSVNISFLVNVDDHVNVVNGTTHLLGIGIQTGTNVLWVEQQSIQIFKACIFFK